MNTHSSHWRFQQAMAVLDGLTEEIFLGDIVLMNEKLREIEVLANASPRPVRFASRRPHSVGY